MDEKEFDYLNVIPLVDVMLVLLTIVLTTSTFIATGGIKVDLPKTAASTDASSSQENASAAEAVLPAPAPGAGQGRGAGDGGIFSVGQLDGPLAVLTKPPPAYPPAAKRRNIEGWIRVKFLVDEHGQVGQISVLAAEPEGIFEQSVLRCVSHWRFKPGTVKGTAVKTIVEQTVTFKLEG